MATVTALLHALVRLDGETIVMREGDIPYIVSERGQQTLGSRPLPSDALSAILEALVPADVLDALDEVGSVEYEHPEVADLAGERFTIVATDDRESLRVDIRRDAEVADLLAPAADVLFPNGQAARRRGPTWMLPVPSRRKRR